MSNDQIPKKKKKLTLVLPVETPTVVISELVPFPPPMTPTSPKKPKKSGIRLKNNLNQMVPVNLRRKDGTTVGIEIPSRSEVEWPDVELGPDATVKVGKKYLTILR